MRYSPLLLSALVLLPVVAAAAVVERVAVVVGDTVFTESEVLDAVRLTEFVNGDPLDLGPEARRAAAERLVDQQLIRNEIALDRYAAPPASDADRLLRAFRQKRFPGTARFQEALRKYGVTEEELKQYLLWQETVLRFTDMRFRPGLPEPPTQSADRLRAGAPAAAVQQPAAPANGTVDQNLNAWLKEARSNTRVVFKQEAFQ